MKRYTLAMLLAITFLASCDCEPTYLPDGSSFAFRLIDETSGENVFPNRFDPFEFEIIDNNGDTIDIDAERYGQDGDYGFFLDPTGGQSFVYDQRFRRTFYLVFDSLDTDTLELFFVPRTDECTEYMDDFEAYYNDELILEGSGKGYYQARAIPKP